MTNIKDQVYILQSKRFAIQANGIADLNKKLNSLFGSDELDYEHKEFLNKILCDVLRIVNIVDVPQANNMDLIITK